MAPKWEGCTRKWQHLRMHAKGNILWSEPGTNISITSLRGAPMTQGMPLSWSWDVVLDYRHIIRMSIFTLFEGSFGDHAMKKWVLKDPRVIKTHETKVCRENERMDLGLSIMFLTPFGIMAMNSANSQEGVLRIKWDHFKMKQRRNLVNYWLLATQNHTHRSECEWA